MQFNVLLGLTSLRTADAFPVVATTGNASAVRNASAVLTYHEIKIFLILSQSNF